MRPPLSMHQHLTSRMHPTDERLTQIRPDHDRQRRAFLPLREPIGSYAERELYIAGGGYSHRGGHDCRQCARSQVRLTTFPYLFRILTSHGLS